MNFLKKLFGLTSKTESIQSDNLNKSSNEKELPFEIKITTSFGSNSSYVQEKFKPITKDNQGNWILNPEAPFILTLLNADKKIADQIRNLLDDEEIRDYRKDDKLVAIFAEHNLKIKEIEDYKTKYKAKYFQKIDNLKAASTEWGSLGEKDKDDLLFEFRQAAIAEIFERANCDIEILFENEPTDISIDDELISEFGFENLQTYLGCADKLEKVRVVSSDNYSRPIFEKLVELNLAIRGADISKEEVLSVLTLKELNLIAENPSKEFKRKNQAIEYILSLEKIDERIGKYISLRELFKLKPLPEKYSQIDIQKISAAWSYHEQEVRLLMDTFRNSYYAWRDLKNDEYIKAYKIEPLDKDYPCPCAKDLSTKIFSKNNPPKMPYHIGCNCFINKEYKYN
ncbi:hypothetical protein [Lacibacter sp. H407]|uniref:hypothetical protein n=1 Tax=Lacibacter sp. H407 TaxID=3133423 RepID=UPI0030BD619B